MLMRGVVIVGYARIGREIAASAVIALMFGTNNGWAHNTVVISEEATLAKPSRFGRRVGIVGLAKTRNVVTAFAIIARVCMQGVAFSFGTSRDRGIGLSRDGGAADLQTGIAALPAIKAFALLHKIRGTCTVGASSSRNNWLFFDLDWASIASADTVVSRRSVTRIINGAGASTGVPAFTQVAATISIAGSAIVSRINWLGFFIAARAGVVHLQTAIAASPVSINACTLGRTISGTCSIDAAYVIAIKYLGTLQLAAAWWNWKLLEFVEFASVAPHTSLRGHGQTGQHDRKEFHVNLQVKEGQGTLARLHKR
jgi:hypothetical protein